MPSAACKNPYNAYYKRHLIIYSHICFFGRIPSDIARDTGVIEMNTNQEEGRLGLIHKKQSYALIGAHLSERYASV